MMETSLAPLVAATASSAKLANSVAGAGKSDTGSKLSTHIVSERQTMSLHTTCQCAELRVRL